MSTAILRTTARIVVPLSMLLALYIYFKGHQSPGGGFVGGLVTSVGLVLQRMSFGAASVRRLVAVPERWLLGVGLLLALGTGTGALLFGLPFMTSNHGHVPGAPQYEWASVMVFDLGVMLVVTGVVVGMINALSEELG